MHSAVFKTIKNLDRKLKNDVFAAAHYVADNATMLAVDDFRRHLPSGSAFPSYASARLPFRRMTLVTPEHPLAYEQKRVWLLSQDDAGRVTIGTLSHGGYTHYGEYVPGETEEFRFSERDDQPTAIRAMRRLKAGPEQVHDLVATMANIALVICAINTPKAVCQTVVAPLQTSKVRRAYADRGMAPMGYTNVSVPLNGERKLRAVFERMARAAGTVAAHRRCGHYAWLPSQRQTPKSERLSAPVAGITKWRGPGFYVWRDETEVGDTSRGCKVQRRLVHQHGKPRPDLGDLRRVPAAERNEALSAAIRATMVKAGTARSATLH